MDQIPTPDTNLINDEFDCKSNSLVNSADANFLESISNDVDGIRCANNNEENKLGEEASESILEAENPSDISENYVSSTCFPESEVIPNGDDPSMFETDYSPFNDLGISKTCANCNGQTPKVVNAASNNELKNNENNASGELPCLSDHPSISTLPSTETETNIDSCNTSSGYPVDTSTKVVNSCPSHRIETNSSNNETATSDLENNFLPTIVEIRGGCTDILEKPSEPITSHLPHDQVSALVVPEASNLNIASVLGGFKGKNIENEVSTTKLQDNLEEMSNDMVHIISDNEEGSSTGLNKCADNAVSNDVTIKQEPHDSVSDSDCVYMGTEHGSANFTSEFVIKEEKTTNAEDENPDVTCIETTSKIPLPIPIKMESIIEANSQSNSSTAKIPEKNTSRKRITRSSSTKSDDCVLLSSGSEANDSSDSRKRNRLPKNSPYSTAGYTCHLCNTVFQEHELLNEHMILHRNNSLIEAKVQNRPKAPKTKSYVCDICQKQLSTSQSLQQHVLIHKNQKPYACPICKKDFRHLSNYRLHLQKHKAEQRRRSKTQQKSDQERLDKSVVRGVDFGRLVGPLFMKESLLHQKKRERDIAASNNKNISTNTTFVASATKKIGPKSVLSARESQQPQPRLSFDKPAFKARENTTATPSLSSSSSTVIIRRRERSPESRSEEECVAVKSFNNIESVVMNAARIIVKLDNLDTSVLKRKLQTPDISIDLAPKRCKIMLSPIAAKCKVKLDEIENIPMDVESGDIDLSPGYSDDYHFDGGVEPDDNDVVTGGTLEPVHGTLTDNELFELLNDDRDTSSINNISPSVAVGVGGSNSSSPLRQSSFSRLADVTKTVFPPVTKSSNVIFMETPPTHEMSCGEDESVENQEDDAFDAAFHKVAVRRLALLHKRAAENAGKVESRYLLGPLFWHKTLRRAKKRAIESSTAPSVGGGSSINASPSVSAGSNSSSPKTLWLGPRRYGGRSRIDDRRTNDPVKLQSRAESKFKCLIERAKMMNNLNTMNLAGPLFWRRTLQLAGVQRGGDLRTYMDAEQLTLDGIQFVSENGTPCDFGADLVVADQQPSVPQSSDRVPVVDVATSTSADHQQNDQLPNAEKTSFSPMHGIVPNDLTKSPIQTNSSPQTMVEQHHQQLQLHNVDRATTNNPAGVTAAKTDSILYESLTKPKENLQQSSRSESLPPSIAAADAASLFVTNVNGAAVTSSLSGPQKCEPLESCLADRLSHKPDDAIGEATVATKNEGIEKLAAIEPGSIVLNVDDGGGLQLIGANSDDRGGLPDAGQNYVLVSDETGTMQYMVNMPGENYGNFELISDGASGDQVTYAIQFDGENYTAVQFVQDGAGVELQNDKGLKDGKLPMDSKAAAYLVSSAGAAATVAGSNSNHIGKELSDFLNLDYGNLLKNGATDQPTS